MAKRSVAVAPRLLDEGPLPDVEPVRRGTDASLPGAAGQEGSSLRRRLSILARRAALVLKEGGVFQVLLRVLSTLSFSVVEFGSVSFFVQDLAPSLSARRAALDVTMRRISSIGLGPMRECDRALSKATLEERFQQGDVCFVAIDAQDKVAHSHWVSAARGRIPELGMELILEPGQAYMYNATTRPDLRGRGLFPAVRDFLADSLHSKGFRRLLFYVRGDNYIGLRAERRWLRSIGKFWYLQVRGLRPLVIGRRAPELPRLIKNGTEESIPAKGRLLENSRKGARSYAQYRWTVSR